MTSFASFGVLFIFALLLAESSSYNHARQSNKPAKPWTSLILSQIWPPTFCKSKKCKYDKTKVTNWNIHGLWPDYGNGQGPENCNTSTPFDIKKLDSIFSQLQVQWADLLSFKNPTGFWKHEWETHGRCAVNDSPLKDELSYFRTTMEKKMQVALPEVLENAGIVPSLDKKYSTSEVLDKLKEHYGTELEIRCETHHHQSFWIETRICMTPSFKLIDCPKTMMEIKAADDKNLYAYSKGTERPFTETCRADIWMIPFDA